MNFYFLLEDEKSFIKVLPRWLDYMNFPCVRVPDISCVTHNTYVAQSGQGIIQLITRVLYETLDSIIESDKKIDYLVIIADAEEYSVDQRYKEIEIKIKDYSNYSQINFKIDILICNCCFETWLLGNCNIYPNDTLSQSNLLYPFCEFYDVSRNDPELMPMDESNRNIKDYHFHSKADYHFRYLHNLCQQNRLIYRKSKPDAAMDKNFYNGIVNRIETTEHISSFKRFFDYIKGVNIL